MLCWLKLLDETIDRVERFFFCQLTAEGKNVLLLQTPHPEVESLHRFAPVTFLQHRMPHYALLRSDSVNSGWKKEEMLAQCLGLCKHHERMINTPSQTLFLSKWHLYENEAQHKQTSGWELNRAKGRIKNNMEARPFRETRCMLRSNQVGA